MGSFVSGLMGGQTGGVQGPQQAGGAAANAGSGFYNTDQLLQQQQFLTALQGQQQGLGAQLQGVANGTGPNPALSQLQATTQQNIGSANAQLAGNRNLNPALAAKMANQNLVQTNQQAGNQAATLSAQQQLGAMSQLGGLYGQQQQGAIAQQNTMNEANLGAQGINSGVAKQNTQNASDTNKAALGAIGGGLAAAAGATGGQVHPSKIGNNPRMYDEGTDFVTAPSSEGMSDTADSIKTDAAAGINSSDDKSLGMDPAFASPAANAAMNPGGISANSPFSTPISGSTTPTGGLAVAPMQSSPPPGANGPSSYVGRFLQGAMGGGTQKQAAGPNMMQSLMKLATLVVGAANGGQMPMRKGGKVDAILSPGEKYLTPAEAREVATGKEKATATGKTVPGKAKVPGDSLKNDIVPAKLKQGGIVIPRSKMGSAKDATAFVKAHFAKRGKLG